MERCWPPPRCAPSALLPSSHVGPKVGYRLSHIRYNEVGQSVGYVIILFKAGQMLYHVCKRALSPSVGRIIQYTFSLQLRFVLSQDESIIIHRSLAHSLSPALVYIVLIVLGQLACARFVFSWTSLSPVLL